MVEANKHLQKEVAAKYEVVNTSVSSDTQALKFGQNRVRIQFSKLTVKGADRLHKMGFPYLKLKGQTQASTVVPKGK